MKDPHLENADIFKVRKSTLARRVFLVGLFGVFCLAYFLALNAEAPTAPEPPKAQIGATSPAPDPCGLADVECPQEAASVSVASQEKSQKVITAMVFTYQAVESQTDGDPCTAADGTDVCPLPKTPVVANNCLDFGAEVEIRGVRYFVHDRMASRYGCDVFDILTTGRNFTLTDEPVTVL